MRATGKALMIGALALVLAAACGPRSNASQPGPTSMASITVVVSPADLADAIRFRVEFGLQADESFVRAVFDNPLAIVRYGVPLLPDEIAVLERRAVLAADVAAVVRTYGRSVPETYAGVFIDTATGHVYGLFVGDVGPPLAAIREQLSPLAPFDARSAVHSLRDLEAIAESASGNAPWLARIGAPLRGVAVSVEQNQVDLILGGVPSGGVAGIYERLGADASALAVTIDPDPLASLPRGSVRGVVIGRNRLPVTGRNLDVVAVGDFGHAEPDGGVGIATDLDGSFFIERLAEMGWTITIRDPVTAEELGHRHIEVVGGQTTRVTIVVD
jgi:hypothetical protein